LTSRLDELSRDRLASDQITETPALVDAGRRHGAQHTQEPVMATVHVGTNTDPHSEHHSGVLQLKVGLLRWRPSRIHVGPSVLTWRSRRQPAVAGRC
jgi:hypothetical protein